jgi:hypothetical protein
MIRLFSPLPLLFLALCTHSQELTHVAFSGASTLSSIAFTTDQQVIVKVTADGKVLEWGTEWDPRRYNYTPGKLEPFMGRVDYYGQEAPDSSLRGKVKSIGTCILTYYGSYDIETKRGKLKSIGHTMLDYYSNYENEAYRGKIQTAGSILFTYFGSYENEAIQGKLKSVNNTQIVYYSTFDDKSIKGKLKSIGMYNYIWYTSNDQYRGALKSGLLKPNVNGVTYYIM